MFSKIKKLFVYACIYLAGLRFYSCDPLNAKQEFRKFVVRTFHNYELTFTFYKERREFITYFFKKIKRKQYTVFEVVASSGDDRHAHIQKYNSMRIFISDNTLIFSNEDITVMALLKVYIDYVLSEANRMSLPDGRLDYVQEITDLSNQIQ